jgi:serine/threonine protein kinase/Tfp pilus assembly protein PilF
MDQQVGRYKIKGQLGKGAMGVVYLAEDSLLNRQAAIKTVDLAQDDPAQREFLRTRLIRDARAAAGLSHPNIVAVFDVVEQGESAYLVLEYIDGETLGAVLNRTPVPDSAFTIGILRAMASALDYTHSRGVVHRDIKPANVMIDRSGIPKIMDFGIARIADSRTTTPTGMVMGTIEYMSPEQIKGEPVDGRSDQFALAAVAYLMLAGGTMFGQHALATLAYKTVNEPPPPVCSRNSRLPPAVDGVISKALAKQPEARYATCSEFVEALNAALSGAVFVAREPTTKRTAAAAPAAAKKGSRTAMLVAVAAATIVAVGAAILRPWDHLAAGPAAVAKSEPSERKPDPTRDAITTPAKAHTSEKRPANNPATAVAATTITASSDPPEDPSADHDAAEPPSGRVVPAAMAAYRRGQDRAKSHDFPAAIAAFSEALSAYPDWPSATFARARVLQRSGQCPEAVRDFNQFLHARPKGFNAYAFRGLCFERLKQDDLALADFEQALALKPDIPTALYGRGAVRLRRGGYKKALADFDDAIRLSPNYAAAFEGRAAAKRQLGDERGAQADLARARQLMEN